MFLKTCVLKPFLDASFELRELGFVLKTLKTGKSPGEDKISYEFYVRESIPNSFLRSIVVPCFKKGDVNSVSLFQFTRFLED